MMLRERKSEKKQQLINGKMERSVMNISMEGRVSVLKCVCWRGGMVGGGECVKMNVELIRFNECRRKCGMIR